MELFHKQTHIDFMKMRPVTWGFSIIATVISLIFLYLNGLNFSLDFTGGTQIELRFSRNINIETIREKLEAAGLEGVKVAQYGTSKDVLIKFANKKGFSEDKLSHQVVDSLKGEDPNLELRQIDFVGAEVGENLAEQGALAVLVALIATMIYIALRFEYRFGVSAAISLLHDPIFILGIFAFFKLEFDLATLAGILAVIGYSLNDTIVVYDRVRENFRKVRSESPLEIMNLSINQTLSRTIMTSCMTLLVVIALYIFGGASLKGFSLALIIGIVIGTYSSIFVAGGLALSMGLSRQDLVPSSKKIADETP